MNNKLQAYFDYFDKHYTVENWYKSLKKWVDIAKKIKDKVSEETFNTDENQKKINLEIILSDQSNGEIKTVASFFDRYLFYQNNGLGNIGQGVIWESENNKHKSKILERCNAHVLIDLLKSNNIFVAEKLINSLTEGINRNYEAAKIRFLRSLFPGQIAAIDAPNKLNRLKIALESKLKIVFQGSTFELHEQLMKSINSTDFYKKQIFFWEIYYMLNNDLNLKKAIVYYGAPGTGKTFKAKKVAEEFIDRHRMNLLQSGPNNNYQIQTVQFHPSYSYEDFMEGIRPGTNSQLSLHIGTFKAFCKKAGLHEMALYKDEEFLSNKKFKEVDYNFSLIKVSELTNNQKALLAIPDDIAEGLAIEEVIEPAFFIIDEINRAELSRVFGELMYSLEYRGYNGKIKTQYAYLNKDGSSESTYFWEYGEDWFFIPQNVYIIGTMNNIDRSVDSFDFTLRRRFMWEEVKPHYDVITSVLSQHGIKKDIIDSLKKSLRDLNQKIEKEDLLGKDYRIGHSYILELRKMRNDRFETSNEAKEFLWKDFIKPLLEEYLRGLGDEGKAKEKLNSFKLGFGL